MTTREKIIPVTIPKLVPSTPLAVPQTPTEKTIKLADDVDSLNAMVTSCEAKRNLLKQGQLDAIDMERLKKSLAKSIAQVQHQLKQLESQLMAKQQLCQLLDVSETQELQVEIHHLHNYIEPYKSRMKHFA